MNNVKFFYILNLLETLNEHFQGNDTVSAGALLLEGNETVGEAIARAIEMMEHPRKP